MTYDIAVSPAAARQLRKLEGPLADASKRRSTGWREPRPPGAKKLIGGGGEWRVRTGDYRIIYDIDDGVLVVLVLAVGHRREIYRHR